MRNKIDSQEIRQEWSVFIDTWQEAQIGWKDAVAARFYKQFMSAWEADMPPFLAALETLEEELQAAERELR